jgi:hypothetical protein
VHDVDARQVGHVELARTPGRALLLRRRRGLGAAAVVGLGRDFGARRRRPDLCHRSREQVALPRRLLLAANALSKQPLGQALQRRDVLLELGDLAGLIADLGVALGELLAQLFVVELEVHHRHMADNADSCDVFQEN